MGAYLTSPITKKDSTDESNDFLTCGASSMQGWRMSQEDAHNSILDFDKNTSFFAVYDGHGGAEVALYCAQHLPKFLRIHEQYALGNYALALREAFIDFDGTLLQERIIEELRKLVPEDIESATDDEEAENLAELCQEGKMPLTELMKKYAKAVTAVGSASATDAGVLVEPTATASSSSASAGGSSSSSSAACGTSSDRPAARRTTATSAKAIDNLPDDQKTPTDNSTSTSSATANGAGTEGAATADAADQTSSAPKKSEENGNATAAKTPPSADDTSSNSDDEEYQAGGEADVKQLKVFDEDNADDDDEDDDDDDDDAVNNDRHDYDDEDEDEDEDEDDDEEETEEEEADDEGNGVADEDDSFLNSMVEGPGSSSGCTAVVALLVERELFVANAGDSRCVVCRDGEALEMSFDHKPEDDAEQERIEKAGGRVTQDGRVNGGLNLSRAIGDHAYKMNTDLRPEEQMISALPDIKHITIEPSDEFMIIACDGIWNFMSSGDVVQFVRTRIAEGHEKMSTICEELFDACLAANTMGDGTGCDNMTAVIVRFKPTLYKRPAAIADAATATNKKRCASSPTAALADDQTKRIKTDDVQADEKAAADATKAAVAAITTTTTEIPSAAADDTEMAADEVAAQ